MTERQVLLVGGSRCLPDGMTTGDCVDAIGSVHGLSVEACGSVADAFTALTSLASVACVVSGIPLNDGGRSFLQRLHERNANVPVVYLATSQTEQIPVDILSTLITDCLCLRSVADPKTTLAETVTTILDTCEPASTGEPAPTNTAPASVSTATSTSTSASASTSTSTSTPRSPPASGSESAETDRYRQLIANIADPVYMIDSDGYVQMVNETLLTECGYTRDELIGTHVRNLIPDEDVERGTEIILDLLRSDDKDSEMLETEILYADGTQRECEDHISIVEDENGDFIGSVGIIRDIEARKERERELTQFETLVQAVPDTVYMTNKHGYLTFLNEAGHKKYGYTNEQIESDSVHYTDIVADEDIETFSRAVRKLLSSDANTKEKAVIEHTSVTNDGRRFRTENHFSLMPSPNRGIAGAGISRDISDRKQRQERLAVLDRLLRHNLRNDLNTMLGTAEVLADRLRNEFGDEESAALAEQAYDVGKNLVRMSQEIRQIQDALEREGRELIAVDAVTIIENVVETYQSEYPNAHIETVLPDRARVEANDAVRLVVENLVENAIEHNDDNPTVTITLTPRETDRGEWYEIRFVDDGPGIPEQERIVIEQNTNETPLQHGSGIGLWAVAWIIQSFNGTIDITTREPHGTIVAICLPQAE